MNEIKHRHFQRLDNLSWARWYDEDYVKQQLILLVADLFTDPAVEDYKAVALWLESLITNSKEFTKPPAKDKQKEEYIKYACGF